FPFLPPRSSGGTRAPPRQRRTAGFDRRARSHRFFPQDRAAGLPGRRDLDRHDLSHAARSRRKNGRTDCRETWRDMIRAFPQLAMEPIYGFFHYLSTGVSDVFFRGEVYGAENIPRTGGYLVAANHASHLDPFIIGSRLPRQMTFFARKTLWKPG